MGAGVRDAFPPPDVYDSFSYGNAAVRTSGRAHRHRPYAFCLRELHVDVRPLRKIAPSRAHLLFIRCRDGTFIRRGKGGFHFYLYLCKQ